MHNASALRAENRALKAKMHHLKRHRATLATHLRVATGKERAGIHNVWSASFLFEEPEAVGRVTGVRH